MDERVFEMASQNEEAERQAALARRVQYQGVSACACEECGAAIPEGRRLAVPGVRLCIECQGLMEVRRG